MDWTLAFFENYAAIYACIINISFLLLWIEILIMIYYDKFGNDRIQDKNNWTERVIPKTKQVFNDEIKFLLLFSLCMLWARCLFTEKQFGGLRLPSQVEVKCRIHVSSIIYDTLWFQCHELTSSLGGGRVDSRGSCRSAAVWWKISIGVPPHTIHASLRRLLEESARNGLSPSAAPGMSDEW